MYIYIYISLYIIIYIYIYIHIMWDRHLAFLNISFVLNLILVLIVQLILYIYILDIMGDRDDRMVYTGYSMGIS